MQGPFSKCPSRSCWFSRLRWIEPISIDKGPFSIAVTSIGEEAWMARVPLLTGERKRDGRNKKGAHIVDRHTRGKNKGARGRQECLCMINEPSAVRT